MNISIEEKKAEALKRMKLLGIYPETVKQFDREGLVSISEPPWGAFYWLEDKEKEIVRQFEEKYHTLVYVGIRSFTVLGKMDCYLYVSDHPGQWADDRALIKSGEQIAYVYNWGAPDCSEMGSIGFRSTTGAGLERTW